MLGKSKQLVFPDLLCAMVFSRSASSSGYFTQRAFRWGLWEISNQIHGQHENYEGGSRPPLAY